MRLAECQRRVGLGWLFEMSMQWKFIPTPPRSTADILEDECFRHLKHTNILTKRPTFIGSARLHIQLSPIQAKAWSRHLLSEAAYLLRGFTIVVELRMKFDISPYPALDAYDKQSGSSLRGEDIVPWLNEPRCFYAGRLPDEFENRSQSYR
jgi:hypothetical protein